MELSYTTRNGQMTVKLEGRSQTEIFEQLSEFQEVFENTTCTNGKDSSDVVNFQTREVDGNRFYEIVCVDETKPALRFAKKKFGVHKNGKTVFPKGSWVKWDKDTKSEVDLRTGKSVEDKKVD